VGREGGAGCAGVAGGRGGREGGGGMGMQGGWGWGGGGGGKKNFGSQGVVWGGLGWRDGRSSSPRRESRESAPGGLRERQFGLPARYLMACPKKHRRATLATQGTACQGRYWWLRWVILVVCSGSRSQVELAAGVGSNCQGVEER